MQISPKFTNFIHLIGYHSHTLYLFTLSDHKPLVYPMTLTGLLNLIAGPTINSNSNSNSFPPTNKNSTTYILSRLPLVFFWVWSNFLIFCLGNQRRPSSISEDLLNKPWRPIPSARLTPSSATTIWIVGHVLVVLASAYSGTTSYTVWLLVLGYMYNDLEGGSHPFFRNLINACAVVVFALGATTVAYTGYSFGLTEKAVVWQCMIFAIVFTTLQLQDLCDQEGDRERGRRTLPIIWGERVTAWSVIFPMFVWSVLVPAFWRLAWWGYLAPCGIGGAICFRALALRTSMGYTKTYKMWGLWVSFLLAMPAMAAK